MSKELDTIREIKNSLKNLRKDYAEKSIRKILKKYSKELDKLGYNHYPFMNFSRDVLDEFFRKQIKLIEIKAELLK